MKLTFCGGVGEVTGSRHHIEVEGLRLLLDCGLFQGHRGEAIQKNRQFLFEPAQLDAVLLSHAHIDHSGGLPLLVKRGFERKILCTPATADLCGVMLMDSAHLQEEDARFFNKMHAGEGQTIEPLYDQDDARRCLALLSGQEFETTIPMGERVRARFHNAGHVPGSAMIEVEAETPKGRRRLLFTGDLGRRDTLLLDPPEIPKQVDYLLIESTYGNRVHDPISRIEGQMTTVIERAVKEKGKILIPSFALERTQEILFVLEKLRRRQAIPSIPVYLDSPMATAVTELFQKYRGAYPVATQFNDAVEQAGDPFGMERVHFVRDAEQSKRLNDLPGPMVIVSASEMCEGGRILHHLRNNIGEETTTILIVGYQAQGTLGRRLADGAKKVKVFGFEHKVWARVEVLHAFSAHADRDDLLWFIGHLDPRPKKIFLVHGDNEDREALAQRLKSEGINGVERPGLGDVFDLD